MSKGDSFEVFKEIRDSFKGREKFQYAYNTLREVIERNISPEEKAKKLIELHLNTYFRLQKSFYYLELLQKLKPSSGTSLAHMELTFFYYEELLSSLLSSIDALAYEIDSIYGLNLSRISIEEVMQELEGDDPLKALLLREIQPQNKNHWYRRLRKQRNIAIHRPTYLLRATLQKRPLFDKDEIEEDLFAKDIKVFEDSTIFFEQVESLIEGAYRHLKGKIKGKKIMHEEDIKGELLSILECPYCGTLVAWREKRTPENWPTEVEKEEYDLWNIEKQMVVRSIGEINDVDIPRTEKLTEEEFRSSVVDFEDVVCILEKLPDKLCPGCEAEVIGVYKKVEKNIEEFLKNSGYNDVPHDVIKEISDWWHDEDEKRPMLSVYQYTVRRKRRCYEWKEVEKLEEQSEENTDTEGDIVDEYKGRKIFKKPLIRLEFDRSLMQCFSVTKEICEEWDWENPEKEVLFVKEKDKALSEILGSIADIYFDKENFKEAKRFYKNSYYHDSSNVGALLRLGLIEIIEGDEQKGIDKCLKAGEMSKQCYFFDIGCAFYQKGKLKEAEKWWEKDLNFNPSSKAAYNLAVVALKQGLTEKSITYLQKSLEIDPEHWNSYLALAEIYHHTGKVDEAINLLEEGMKKIIEEDEEGRLFYKDEEKGKEMNSLLKKLKGNEKQE